ncbi:MAG: hypothetical protein ACK559_22465, partial [bacterium]
MRGARPQARTEPDRAERAGIARMARSRQGPFERAGTGGRSARAGGEPRHDLALVGLDRLHARALLHARELRAAGG